MPGYVALLVDIHDGQKFMEYARQVHPLFSDFEGRAFMRGPITEVVEGELPTGEDTRLVLFEFPTVEAAKKFWDSDEYQRTIPLREPPVATTYAAFVVDGVDLTAAPQ
jgi:uncharacterized protein (DUF1330 family)